MELVFGVMDAAYSDAHGSGATTTGEVAEILEEKYHPFRIFFEERKGKILEWIAEAAADYIADVCNGRRPNSDPYAGAMELIESEFRAFLDADELSAILPLTQQITAAQMGKNSRKKSGYNKNNDSRAALIDSGLFQASARAWITQAVNNRGV